MAPVKIGINGFGRIGRTLLRIIAERGDVFDLCAINLRKPDIPRMVYLAKYDSVFGRFNGTIESAEDGIIINGKFVRVFGESDAAKIPWDTVGAEYIVESTGAFRTTEQASRHLKGGAKKVVITAPAKDNVTPTFVIGVNEDRYESSMEVVSNASCTTNCLAPLVKVLCKEVGVERGFLITVHAATAKQSAVDDRKGSDWRIGRSVLTNIIPTSTGAAKAVGLVIPEMQGRITGTSIRVPVADASLIDLTAELTTKLSYGELCAVIKRASETYMKGIIEYAEDPMVSSDIIGKSSTCIFDAAAGMLLDGDFVKLIAWYDNEWGYSNKVLDLVKHMHDTDCN